MNTHFTADEYAFYALGNLDPDQEDELRGHLQDDCAVCKTEAREAFGIWFTLAALTAKTQTQMELGDPPPELRQKVIGIGRGQGISRTLRTRSLPVWVRIAAAVLLTAGAATLSWNIERLRTKQDVAAVQARVEQQQNAARKLESENNSLRNLLAAARNAPAVFPGRDSIVSVQDPYLLRDLQRAKQTQVAASEALNEERAKAANLEKTLSQTTSLLAAATRDREDADRQSKKAFDAAMLESERGVNQLSTELSVHNTKIQNLESEVARYRTMVDSQKKKIEQQVQMMSLLESHAVSLVQLRATGAEKASGVALIADDSRLAFFPSNLPDAPAGRTYQLWLIREKAPAMASAGTFNGTTKDAAALQFGNKTLLAGIKSLLVTDEPAGGSASPTGHKVMIGTAPKN